MSLETSADISRNVFTEIFQNKGLSPETQLEDAVGLLKSGQHQADFDSYIEELQANYLGLNEHFFRLTGPANFDKRLGLQGSIKRAYAGFEDFMKEQSNGIPDEQQRKKLIDQAAIFLNVTSGLCSEQKSKVRLQQEEIKKLQRDYKNLKRAYSVMKAAASFDNAVVILSDAQMADELSARPAGGVENMVSMLLDHLAHKISDAGLAEMKANNQEDAVVIAKLAQQDHVRWKEIVGKTLGTLLTSGAAFNAASAPSYTQQTPKKTRMPCTNAWTLSPSLTRR